jgi:hypothetical protein
MTKFEMHSHPSMALFESKLQCYDDTAQLFNMIIFGLKGRKLTKLKLTANLVQIFVHY